MKRKDPKYKYQYVMLLDDNELDNFINQKIIEANHFSKKIYTNTSGKSALEFLSNLLVLEEDSLVIFPRVIFIDINMPIMDGFQFVKSLKNLPQDKLKDCKLVILTSSMFEEDQKKAKELLSNIVFLNKPLNETALNLL
jgi:CheY-like chemotaxis protein